MDILAAIKKAFNVLPDLASSIGRLALVVVILGLVIGVFVYQAVTAGNINVDAASLTMINGTSNNFSAVVGTIWDAATSITGFIVIGVIAVIALALLGKKLMGSGGQN